MISPSDRVTIWQSQLAANDFPPVCAMCGAPAETWRKFKFSTAPPWAFLLGLIVAMALSRRASGYLPMTRACSRSIRLVRMSPLLFVALMAIFWIVAIVAAAVGVGDRSSSAVAVYLGFVGTLFMVMAVIVLLLTNRYGPGGKVMEQQYGQYEPVIELQRVNPKFVAAVQQMQQTRAAQYAAGAQLPLHPGSR